MKNIAISIGNIHYKTHAYESQKVTNCTVNIQSPRNEVYQCTCYDLMIPPAKWR